MSIYKNLFFSVLKISATTFGGGFVIIPLLKHRFVDELQLIEEDEMLDLVAIAQSCPGPIAVNASVLAGYKAAGIKGGLLALLGSVIPPITIISIISVFYAAFRDNKAVELIMSGMLCGVAAVIMDVVIDMIKKMDKAVASFVILILCFVLSFIFKINVLIVILIAAVLGIIKKFVGRSKE